MVKQEKGKCERRRCILKYSQDVSTLTGIVRIMMSSCMLENRRDEPKVVTASFDACYQRLQE